MKVQATQIGYYQHKRRREGDIFHLIDIQGKNAKGQKISVSAAQQFSTKWMRDVDGVLNLPPKSDEDQSPDPIEPAAQEQQATPKRTRAPRQAKTPKQEE